ncbi:PREDICTED: heat shock 70 kDa protein 4-like isoform X2 [Amphimedon queenslandica]|uniref:Uncharacterized protein n=1 Tax=Amphimedon queenslandica TaxID=400682 RepID=A0AAN0II66_AMPQE|nr:PREDICTED: heat shock 70 kDa protein 4-like isoform X2 [Amphimedon queenslandica]|eukprot:XP_003390556.1 PREDICTED: heat shock 70 kDa protein 4-like isoform X2 [Amphimedon queenslandica]
MSVVGIDIGYQSCYVAIARHGGVEVITNDYSERSSPSMVGFTPKERVMSTSAKNQSISNLKNTITGFKALVGRSFSDPVSQSEIEGQPYEAEQLPGDKIGIKVNYLDEAVVLSPEQITAVMLTYLKQITQKALEKPVSDCVISVPSYFTDSQRRAVLDASSISGLNCLRLLNETTAVALAYGIYKQDLPEEKEKSRNVVFIDMGHHALQVSVCAFNKGKLKVLSKAADHLLGGRDFDKRLLHHFAEEFKVKYKIDALSRIKQTARLRNECEKLRKLMSSNATPIPMNIECFMDDKDVSSKMKREEFEDLCKDLLERVKVPILEALRKSGLKRDDIYGVEIVGGMTRVPAIRKIISDIFNKECSTTLNQDEAVCKGCALQCAILSPTFKVRDFAIQDTQPYPIQLLWEINGEPGDMTVFLEGDSIYHSKVLTFYRKEPFVLQVKYKDQKALPVSNSNIGKFLIKGVKANEEGESTKVKVKVRLSIHGIFFIKSATLIMKQAEEMETGQIEEIQNVESDTKAEPKSDTQASPADSETQSSNSDASLQSQEKPQDDVTDNDTMDSTVPQPEGPSSTSENGQQKSDVSTAQTEKSPATKKAKQTYKHVDLPVDETTYSLSKKVLEEAFEKEVAMIQSDKLEAEKADAKNSVEEYVYDMRDKLEGPLSQFVNEEDKTKLMSLLEATEEWLYDEGEDQAKKVYIERLADMKKQGDPIVARMREFEFRDSSFNELGHVVVRYEKILMEYEQGDEKYNHLSKEDMEKVQEATTAKREWMNSKMQAQQKVPLTADPVVKVSEITMAKENLYAIVNPIVSKPKPKVEPPKDDQAVEGEGGDETGKEENKTEDKMEDVPPAPADPPVEDMDVD